MSRALSLEPNEIDHHFADGVFVKAITVAAAGSLIPQHSHVLDHISFLATGEVMAWCDGEYIGRLKAPQGVVIKAGTKHTFLTVTPNTTLLCIHNLGSEDAVRVLAEHEFTPGEVAGLLKEVVI